MAIFRFLFWLLLLSNLVLLTLMPGPLPGFTASEPERLAQQVQPNSIRLLSNPLTHTAAPGAPAAPACTEIGEFNGTTAAKFEARLARLKLPTLPAKQMVQPPTASLVFIPPQPDEKSANRRLAQLRTLGFKDVSVVKEPPARRWGISVGLFSSGELALAQLESLKKAGISDARIEEHPVNSARYAYRLQGLAAEDKPELKTMLVDFPGVDIHSCPK